MKGTLILGRFFGIKVQIHWTFLFLIGWVIYLELRKGSDWPSILLTVFFVLVIFLCVILHEFGHALTARKFGIKTKQITLLPIGGVASLEKMPEDPRQELWVAIAGPAVNLVIAFILSWFVDMEKYFANPEVLEQITIQNFTFYLLMVNLTLVLFNIIPAFPMDGGRVLRALLSFKMERTKATETAARLGQLIAVIFFFLGFMYNPFLILIGVFVFFGAQGENMMVHHISLLKGYKVSDAMMTHITAVSPHQTLKEVVDIMLAGTERHFVVAEGGEVKGIIYQNDLLQAIKEKGNEGRIEEAMNSEVISLSISDKLSTAYTLLLAKRNLYIPVLTHGVLTGAIDL